MVLVMEITMILKILIGYGIWVIGFSLAQIINETVQDRFPRRRDIGNIIITSIVFPLFILWTLFIYSILGFQRVWRSIFKTN